MQKMNWRKKGGKISERDQDKGMIKAKMWR